MTLKEEWAKLAVAKDGDRKEIQGKINSIEQWCINNKIGNFKELTDFSKPFKMKKTYRYEAGRDGGHNIPDGARTGRDRCGTCKFNNHAWCALNIFDENSDNYKPCMAKV